MTAQIESDAGKIHISRRDFIKLLGIAAGGVLTSCTPRLATEYPTNETPTLEPTPLEPTPEPIPTIEAQKTTLGKILFLTKGDQNYSVELAESDGSVKTHITDKYGGWIAWAPDGTKFATVINGERWKDSFGSTRQNLALKVFNANGDEQMQFEIPEQFFVNELNWAADGKSILYDLGEFDLNSGGKFIDLCNLLSEYTVNDDLSISPNRKTFVYVHHEYGGFFTVYALPYNVNQFPYKNWEMNGPFRRENLALIPQDPIFINPDGVLDDVHDRQFKFSWTPDGATLIFQYESKLYLYDMTKNPSTRKIFDFIGGGGENYPISVSQDGQKVISGQFSSIIMANINTGESKTIKLPKQVQYISAPSWLHGDNQIAFRGLEGNIYIMNSDGSQLAEVLIGNKSCTQLSPIFQNWPK